MGDVLRYQTVTWQSADDVLQGFPQVVFPCERNSKKYKRDLVLVSEKQRGRIARSIMGLGSQE